MSVVPILHITYLSQILPGILWGEMTSGRVIVPGPLSSSDAFSLKLGEIVISSVKFGVNRIPGTNQGCQTTKEPLDKQTPENCSRVLEPEQGSGYTGVKLPFHPVPQVCR